MNVTPPVAGRSRDVDAARAFFPIPEDFGTLHEPSPTPSSSPYGWKFALQLRIWSGDGPKGNAARSVLTVLIWSSDDTGRTWLGIRAIMKKSGLGNERTVRKAIKSLAIAGWLRLTPQTWSSLCEEQRAVGRQAPRRGDLGQAPNLYMVLAGPTQTVTPEIPRRPGLASTTVSTVDETPRQICQGDQGQIGRGQLGANLPADPDPLGSESMKKSEKSERSALNTHDFSKAQEGKGTWGWLESWQIIVQAHAAKTKGVYGLAPMEPDMKRSDRKALADCLDGASTEVTAKLRSRGIERELVDVRRELAELAMVRYFRNDTPHLRKTKHALRDLPREWHARITEAMQGILRESYDKQSVRRPVVLELEQLPTPLEQATEPTKAEKPAETAPSVPVKKPLPKESMPVNTAREARKLIEALSARQEPSKSSMVENAPPQQPRRQARPEWLVDEAEQDRAHKQAPKAPEMPPVHRDELETIERPIVRPGAPRWGTLRPSPTRVRRVSRPQKKTGDGSEPSTE